MADLGSSESRNTGAIPGRSAAVLGTTNCTGSSPTRGMLEVTVIHGTSDIAVRRQAFCRGPPQAMGSLCWMTLKVPEPPADPKVKASLRTA